MSPGISHGAILRHALSILRLHPLGFLATSFVVVFVPSLWGDGLVDPIAERLAPEPADPGGDNWGEILQGIIAMLPEALCAFGTVLLLATIVHVAVAKAKGAPQGFAPSLRASLRDYPRCALAAITIALIAGLASLLIIPGVLVTGQWSLAVPVIAAERASLGEAFARSRHLTEGHRRTVIGWMLPLALLWGASNLLQTIDDWWDISDVESWMARGIGAALQMTLSLIGSAGLAAVYLELRWLKDGAGSADTLAAFD